MMPQTPLKTLLIHPYPVEREALSAWFGRESGIHLTATLRDLPDLPCPVLDAAHLVVVFDYDMEKLPSRITHLRKTCPGLRFAVFRPGGALSDIRDLVCAGVSAILDAASDTDEWYGAIRAIARGQIYFDQRIMQNLAALTAPHRDFGTTTETDHPLSLREMEILALVAREYSTSRIAAELFISIKTVETHRRNLFQKLHVKNVVGLTKVAMRLGVLG
ncbi:nitrate/nitrite response regulator protein [Dyadobacter beijingensis]|uniref:Nitrate/nitrite response regulator protein n=1 Tax=Dyadobacter beijingensis TaxID=365489 RepID=A0ABQ2IAH6_9BACT|nr:response regulator transcription factor [Dyadobacter beijingensis]GGN04178.1 nitrate/nitrite response regulator protein [Dyadobacter beijingensis]